MIKHATYIGPDCGWNVTKGLGALIQPSDKPGIVLAQFDDFLVQRDGKDLCFGWHEFPEGDFQMDTMLCGSVEAAYRLLKEMNPTMDKVAVVEYFPDYIEVFAYQFFGGETNIATFIPSQSSLILQDRPYSLSREHTHIFKD